MIKQYVTYCHRKMLIGEFETQAEADAAFRNAAMRLFGKDVCYEGLTPDAEQFLRDYNAGYSPPTTAAELANFLACSEGLGYRAAYDLVFLPEKYDTWQEHAKELRARKKPYQFIADFLRCCSFYKQEPSLSQVIRACDPEQYAKHRDYMRRRMRRLRKQPPRAKSHGTDT